MYTRPLTLQTPKSKTIVFTGGINEAESNLEMKPGLCFDMNNYEEVSGEYHGYRSTMGYEKIDGTTETIEDPNNEGEYLDVTWASTVPLVYTDPTDLSLVDDTARELRRTNISYPTNTTYLKAAFDYNGNYFVVSYYATTGDHKLWMMDTTGWTEITSFPAINEATDSGVNYHVTQGRFQFFPFTASSAQPNDEITVLCNGISKAILLWVDDLGDYYCTEVTESLSPDYSAATPVLPSDATIDEAFPFRSEIFNQRLHLAFPLGTLFISHPGDPFAYDPAVCAGGVFWMGSEMTDMVVSPSSLTVFMEKGVDVIKVGDADTAGFDEYKEQFSKTTGAYPNTAQRILGKTLFCDDRGITYLEATDKYGDFDVANLSRKVQKTYQKNKDIIAGAIVDRDKSQYIVYFQDGTGIVLTVEPDFYGNFSTKGISKFNLGMTVNTVWSVVKEPKRLFTTTTDSYLRLQHRDACSFDGAAIISRFSSSFHGYGTNVGFKQFQRLLFELTATKGQTFSMRPIYDYSGTDIPKSVTYESEPQPDDTALWGEGVWGTFVWGGVGAVNQEYSYITGIGTNMSVQFISNTKHHLPHVVHNMIVLYANGQTKW